MDIDVTHLPAADILRMHANLSSELRRRGIAKSNNNPVADVANALFCRAFNWEPVRPATHGYNARGRRGRIQIKSRRLMDGDWPAEFSSITLEPQQFDYLACVAFAEDYSIKTAVVIAHDAISDLANSDGVSEKYRLELCSWVIRQPSVENASDRLRRVKL